MREYEFRAKRVDSNQWVYGYYSKLYDKETNNIEAVISYQHFETADTSFPFPTVDIIGVKVDEETVGQYTGLKDKNGVQIFDGDILKKGNQIILVLWNEKYASFTLHCNNWGACISFFYEDIYPEDCEVVGNNIDNPDLLK